MANSPPPTLLIALLATGGLVLTSLFGGAGASHLNESNLESRAPTLTKIQITIDGTKLTGTIEDNAASRDFIAMLPLTLELEDFHGIEKVADLPGRLSTEGAAPGYAASAGDITYYAPWGNLAIFYRDFEHARGLIRLGQLDSDLELLKQEGRLKATIERTGPRD